MRAANREERKAHKKVSGVRSRESAKSSRQSPVVGRQQQINKVAKMKSRLRKGEIAEALFVAKVLSLGMNVSKPFGQNCRYDFMVEVMGRATRVQVKSTWQKQVSHLAFHVSRGPSRGRSGFRLRAPARHSARSRPQSASNYVVRAGGTTTRGARRYRDSEVDYIAAYVGPEDEWYVIPVGKIPSAFTIVLPGRYARYREAWELLCPKSIVLSEIKACAAKSSLQFHVSSFQFPVSSCGSATYRLYIA